MFYSRRPKLPTWWKASKRQSSTKISAASRLSNRTPEAPKLMNELRFQETGRSCGGESKNPKAKI